MLTKLIGFLLIFCISLPVNAQSGNKIAFEHDNGYGIYAMNADGTNAQLIVNDAYGDSYAAWSPDGKLIAYASIKNGSPDIYVVNVDGSNPRRLTSSGNALYPVWSADGHSILFSGNDGIDSIDVDGTNLHQLVPRGNAQFAVSPNGQSVAYESNDQIVAANTDGSNSRALTVDVHAIREISFFPSWPSWSADGKQIVFSAQQRQSFYIFVVTADTKNQRRLNTGSEALFPSWSGDGKSVVFTGLNRTAQNGDCKTIYTIGIASGILHRLTDGCGDSYATWSPDSKRILFVSDRDQQTDIDVMDGSTVTGISNGPGKNTDPAWSPNGQSLAFVSTRDGNQEIYKSDLTGSAPQRLTNDPHNDHTCPRWSPDGKTISFVSSGTKTGVYMMDADGNNSHLIQPGPHRIGSGCPTWSPDGQHFTFVSNDILYVADANGKKPVSLSTYKDKSIGLFVWSPDSQSIVYTTSIAAYVIKSDGTNRHNLSFIITYAIAWSPDSQHVAFIGDQAIRAEGPLVILATVDVNGSNQKNLIAVAGELDSKAVVSWSGHAIVFLGYHNKVHKLYSIDDDGSPLQQLGGASGEEGTFATS